MIGFFYDVKKIQNDVATIIIQSFKIIELLEVAQIQYDFTK